MLYKNTANQKVVVFAKSIATNRGVTGLNFTTTISKDGGSFSATTNADSELSGGWYVITLTQTETNCDLVALHLTCSDDLVPDISVVERTVDLANIGAAVWGQSDSLTVGGSMGGLLLTAKEAVDTEVAAIKAQTDLIPASPATASAVSGVSALVALVKAKTDLLTFTGTDVRATLDGEKTSPVEADVRAALGLASANLDTQLSTIDTVADAVKAKTDNLPTDPADQSILAGAISAAQTVIDQINAKTVFLPANTSTELDAIDAAIAAVNAKTTNLPVDPADQSLLMAAIAGIPGGGGGGTVVVAPLVSNVAQSTLGAPLVRVDQHSTLPNVAWTLLDASGAPFLPTRARLAIFDEEDDDDPFIVDTTDVASRLTIIDNVVTLALNTDITSLSKGKYNLWSLNVGGTTTQLVASGKWIPTKRVIGAL